MKVNMSYLNPLRLHFAGKFQAAPSTVNNDIAHFNNKTFLPDYQQLQTDTQLNGWWNPRGDAAWRLIGCNVTSAWQADGSPVDPGDMILTCLIADSDRQAPAKLVDLDPEQQLVSAIWGLEVRICDQNGNTLLRGQYETASFMDIWDRAQSSGGGDTDAGAMYQSTLKDLEWGDIQQSPFLMALQSAAQDGLLSIKFNVDGYNMSFGSPDFTTGRIVGTIGPASADEPMFFTPGRQFMAVGLPPGPPPGPIFNFFAPTGRINFCTAVVERKRKKILLDLGNALPTLTPGGPIMDLGDLSLAYWKPSGSRGTAQWMTVDTLTGTEYTADGWYERTAGVVEFPADRSLTNEELRAIGSNALALLLPLASMTPAPAIMEAEDGLHVRPDRFVFRMSPGDRVKVQFYATRFGQPYPGAKLTLVRDPSQLQVQSSPPPQLAQEVWPQPAVPENAIQFPRQATSGANGIAVVTIRAGNPGNHRKYIDGQVYGVRATVKETVAPPPPQNPWNFVSLLIWDAFTPDDPVTWWGSLQPIFQQYANLYPVMDAFLDLGDYESVCANLGLLRLTFGLDPQNPNAMPVTRDLSPAKRAAILSWLNNTGRDGKPLLGKAPPVDKSTVAGLTKVTAGASASPKANMGGKAAAASRRLALRSASAK